MTEQRIKEGDAVLPGERLGVIEEFLPGTGTFQDEDDVIYASITGIVHIDMKERKISVEGSTRQPVYPKRNDVVLGQIQHVTKKSAIINIFRIGDIECPVTFSGYLFIKNTDISPGTMYLSRLSSMSGFVTSIKFVLNDLASSCFMPNLA